MNSERANLIKKMVKQKILLNEYGSVYYEVENSKIPVKTLSMFELELIYRNNKNKNFIRS